jgi:hypothetical protein
LDDVRTEPDGWIRCFWPDEVISLLATESVDEMSLDHDLGDDERGTGYDVLKWLEEQVFLNMVEPPQRIVVHSANPVAQTRMREVIRRIFSPRRSFR